MCLQVLLVHSFPLNFATPLNLILPVSKALMDLVRIDICTAGPNKVNPVTDAIHFNILFDDKVSPWIRRGCNQHISLHRSVDWVEPQSPCSSSPVAVGLDCAMLPSCRSLRPWTDSAGLKVGVPNETSQAYLSVAHCAERRFSIERLLDLLKGRCFKVRGCCALYRDLRWV